MATLTTTLPDSLIAQLSEYSSALKVPKNKFIERALRIYFEQLKRAEYISSYTKAGNDQTVMDMAEEGMTLYLRQISDTESK